MCYFDSGAMVANPVGIDGMRFINAVADRKPCLRVFGNFGVFYRLYTFPFPSHHNLPLTPQANYLDHPKQEHIKNKSASDISIFCHIFEDLRIERCLLHKL
jgi:hypothetical protein